MFRVKVPEDYLRLRVPVWVRATGIVSGTGNRPLVAVATGYHQVCNLFPYDGISCDNRCGYMIHGHREDQFIVTHGVNLHLHVWN